MHDVWIDMTLLILYFKVPKYRAAPPNDIAFIRVNILVAVS